MLGKTRIQELAQQVLTLSTADQTEVLILTTDTALTRFANSTIHQNVAETDLEVRIRVVLGSRVGVAVTNQTDDESIGRAVQAAVTTASLAPENPDFRSLPQPLLVSSIEAYSPSTAECTPEARANGVGTICALAHQAGMSAFGALTTAVEEIGVVNSLGVGAYHVTTRADINTVVMSGDSSGYAAAFVQDVDQLDYDAIGREALDKCLRSQGPGSLIPGEYAVVLEPYATQDIVMMLAYTGLGALAMQEGRSFMAGLIGQQIVDPRISIWDDGLDPSGMPLPFDFEGVPKGRVDLIERGVARGVVYDTYTAGKEGRSSTGHALPAPSRMGPLPANLFMATGDSSLEEMVGNTERGIYVTRFHYTRPVEPKRVVITGMTRDGTFMIEDGKLTRPIKNLRFTQSYLEALNSVLAIGRRAQDLAAWGFIQTKVPALHLSAFNFTGATEY